jgi:hypothetical protein
MGHEETVSHNPWLCRAVTDRALGAITCMARCKRPSVVAQDTTAPRLIEGDPVLDLGPKGVEYNSGVTSEVGNKFFLVEESAISFVQFIRKIPMEKGHHWRDACGMKIVNEFEIELKTFLVDGIIAAAQRNDTRPGNRIN